MTITRKDFLKLSLAGIGAGVCFGCSGSSDPELDSGTSSSVDSGAASCTDAGTEVSIGSNHGHELTVSKEDVAAGTEQTYSIQGTASHDHEVTVTADHFASLQAGTSVVIASSSTSSHTHEVTVSCAQLTVV